MMVDGLPDAGVRSFHSIELGHLTGGTQALDQEEVVCLVDRVIVPGLVRTMTWSVIQCAHDAKAPMLADRGGVTSRQVV